MVKVIDLAAVVALSFLVPFTFKLGLSMADVVSVKMVEPKVETQITKLGGEKFSNSIDMKKSDRKREYDSSVKDKMMRDSRLKSEVSGNEKAVEKFKNKNSGLIDKKNNLIEIRQLLDDERVRSDKRIKELNSLIEMTDNSVKAPGEGESGVASESSIIPKVSVVNALKDANKAPKAKKDELKANKSEEKRSFRPKLGYDRAGKQMNSAGVRYQISEVAKKLPMDYTINYLAKGEEKAQIFVFTDPTCPYCRKLHKDLSKFTNAGITVRYMFYPRGGYENNPVVTNMQATWCSSDQRAAMDRMKAGYPVKSFGCDITENQKNYGDIVIQHMTLAKFFEISGTPTVFSSEGGLAVGYSNAGKMIKALGYGKK
jgi:ssDNA-binding Zn-finger/Zn-ribbon topoisomerase 1